MKRQLRRWFFLKKVELSRKKFFKRKKISFDKDFEKRVKYLAKLLGWQLCDKVKVSFGYDKACLSHKDKIIIEVSARHCFDHTYIAVVTTLGTIPRWWITLAFSDLKWTASRDVERRQLTYVKPREN